MGYPMTWGRMMRRNGTTGDYENTPKDHAKHLIAGDARRLELDTRDAHHLSRYAKLAGVTQAQVQVIFDAFFHEYDTPWQMNCPCDLCAWWRQVAYGQQPAAPERAGAVEGEA